MSILFSTVAAPIYISTNSVKVFCFFTSSSTYVISGFFDDNNSDHSSTLAWKIPWTEEPDGLQSMGSLRVRHDWAPSLSLFTFLHWRRKWQPTPVFLPGESQERGSLVAAVCGITQSRTRLKWLTLFWQAWGEILWFWFLFLWWLAMLSIFSCDCWSSQFCFRQIEIPLVGLKVGRWSYLAVL